MRAAVAPSLLAADFANLAAEIGKVEAAGAQMLHFDVMDGHFVPNLTVGIPVLRAVRKMTDLHLDVHLMISNPDQMAEEYVEAGADSVSVHYEASVHLDQTLARIRKGGVWAGVVLNPHTPVVVLEEILPRCDYVLIMSVNPGFGGQEFIEASLQKVRKLKTEILRRGLGVKIEIDGGIDLRRVAEAVRAGVDILVAGTAIFRASDPGEAFRTMQREAEQACAQAS